MFYKIKSTIRYFLFVVGILSAISIAAIAQELPSINNEDSSNGGVTIESPDAVNNQDVSTENNNSDDSRPDIAPNAPMLQPAPVLGGDNQQQSLAESSSAEETNTTLSSSIPAENPQDNNILKAYNNFVEETDRQALQASQQQADSGASFGDKIMNQVKEDLFSQMADIEKQTGLLSLELKRERIKNEIAAMKAQRQRAKDEEKERELQRKRAQEEWEKEQERKLLIEQRKLKELSIKYEKLRQERVLKAYKETMLKNNQEWIDYNARLYNQLVKEEEAQKELLSRQKEYLKNITSSIERANMAAKAAKEKYTKEITTLQTQVAVLKSKLEAEKKAFEESKQTGPNPFALVDITEDEEAPKAKISDEYAIMEISGKGEVLVAKLINKNGGTFMVKPGTILNTGHVIEEITQTYITADRNGVKDYLYFSAGGILDKEPTKPINAVSDDFEDEEEILAPPSSEKRLPSLRDGMFLE
ncbi:MAG: hypothetical protein IJ660_04535 [Alphaproteobacteria bacterium]|nr:hypothetical protein [Alphaproteobacteria bacterium]